jgi:hypothetical protein
MEAILEPIIILLSKPDDKLSLDVYLRYAIDEGEIPIIRKHVEQIILNNKWGINQMNPAHVIVVCEQRFIQYKKRSGKKIRIKNILKLTDNDVQSNFERKVPEDREMINQTINLILLHELPENFKLCLNIPTGQRLSLVSDYFISLIKQLKEENERASESNPIKTMRKQNDMEGGTSIIMNENPNLQINVNQNVRGRPLQDNRVLKNVYVPPVILHQNDKTIDEPVEGVIQFDLNKEIWPSISEFDKISQSQANLRYQRICDRKALCISRTNNEDQFIIITVEDDKTIDPRCQPVTQIKVISEVCLLSSSRRKEDSDWITRFIKDRSSNTMVRILSKVYNGDNTHIFKLINVDGIRIIIESPISNAQSLVGLIRWHSLYAKWIQERKPSSDQEQLSVNHGWKFRGKDLYNDLGKLIYTEYINEVDDQLIDWKYLDEVKARLGKLKKKFFKGMPIRKFDVIHGES